jgi:hypothetical protein
VAKKTDGWLAGRWVADQKDGMGKQRVWVAKKQMGGWQR